MEVSAKDFLDQITFLTPHLRIPAHMLAAMSHSEAIKYKNREKSLLLRN